MIHIGISFDLGGYTDHTVIPDRAGYLLRLGMTDEMEYDPDGTEKPGPADISEMLKDMSFRDEVSPFCSNNKTNIS